MPPSHVPVFRGRCGRRRNMPRRNMPRLAAAVLAVALAGGAGMLALAQSLDIADVPIATAGGQAKPNVMLLMDTSDSMLRTHMPDDWEFDSTTYFPMGYKSALCNPLYYNPATRYQLPLGPDGRSLPLPPFGAAPYDGYDPGSRKVNLATEFQAYDRNTRRLGYQVEDKKQAAYYFEWSNYFADGRRPLPSFEKPGKAMGVCSKPYITSILVDDGSWPDDTRSSNIYALLESSNTLDTTEADGYWTRRRIPEAQQQNFAIWYSYYRSRLNMAKSSVSRAFHTLDDNFRVGFVTVAKPQAGQAHSGYLPLADFDAAQKQKWFSAVQARKTGGASPMREALARVGRHYAGRTDGINDSMPLPGGAQPIQRYCQRNYAIATTDGYWNTADETAGPVGLDGTTLVGQQDGPPDHPVTGPEGLTPRPIFDGAQSGIRWVHDATNTYEYAPCTDQGFTLTEKASGTKTVTQYRKIPKKDVQEQSYQEAAYQGFKQRKRRHMESLTLVEHEDAQLPYTQLVHKQYLQVPLMGRVRVFRTRLLTKNFSVRRLAVVQTRSWQEQRYETWPTVTITRVEKRAHKYVRVSGENNTAQVVDFCDVAQSDCKLLTQAPAVVDASTCQSGRDAYDYQVSCHQTVSTRNDYRDCAANHGKFVPQLGNVACSGTSTVHDGPVPSCNAQAGNVSFGPCRERKEETDVEVCTPSEPTQSNAYVRTRCGQRNMGSTSALACTPGYDAATRTHTQCVEVTQDLYVPKDSCVPGADWVVNQQTQRQERCDGVVDENTTWITSVSDCRWLATSQQGTNNQSNGYRIYRCETYDSGSPEPRNPAISCQSLVNTRCVDPKEDRVLSVTPMSADACQTALASAPPPSQSNGWTVTTCETVTARPAFSCQRPQGAASVPGYGPRPTQSCRPYQEATPGNQCMRYSCHTQWEPPLHLPEQEVPACTASEATEANGWTATECRAMARDPIRKVQACTQGEVVGNRTTVHCEAVTKSQDMAFGTCNQADAGPDNDWVKTRCTRFDDPVYLESKADFDACQPGTNAQGVETLCQQQVIEHSVLRPGDICQPGYDASVRGVVTCDWTSKPPQTVQQCPSAAELQATGATCTPIERWKIRYVSRWTSIKYSLQGTQPGSERERRSGTVSGDLENPPVCYAAHERPALPQRDSPTDGRGREKLPATHQTSPACAQLPCHVDEMDPATGGSPNALADVAQYYYATDLRPDMPDRVKPVGTGAEDDKATWQHMATHVIGMGVSGVRDFRKDYKTSASGDFAEIRKGTKTWPVWPPRDAQASHLFDQRESIDDFWHAAVNGRGLYFSADDPQAVEAALQQLFVSIRAAVGSGSGVAVAAPVTDNGSPHAYGATYKTGDWSGDVEAFAIDAATGQRTRLDGWSARARLDARAHADRSIYAMGARGALLSASVFQWNQLSAAHKALIAGSQDSVGALLSQFGQMSDSQKAAAASGANLVQFIRGDRTHEGFASGDDRRLYRTRASVLGDIVGSQPTYVGPPQRRYQDAGYAAFRLAQRARKPMVYVGANDGMLHAFHAEPDTRKAEAAREAWAFVPTAVMAGLPALASADYEDRHRYFVDGTPVAGDIHDGTRWRSILVGGLNKGGNGYYALDVTDPLNPRGLWEFETGGYSFGRPLITKVGGTWVVLLTSGYAIGQDSGSSKVFMLNAGSGELLQTVEVPGRGLREINNWVSNPSVDNSTERLYGGDLQGQVWRIPVVSSTAGARLGSPVRLATLADDQSRPQPVTTRVELVPSSGNPRTPRLLVGTGRLYGLSDLGDTQMQTVYGFDDPEAAAPYLSLRSALKQMQLQGRLQSQGGTGERTLRCTGSATDCKNLAPGWYVDLPDSGERVNANMRLAHSTLVFASNVPSNEPCEVGGYGWINYLDWNTGAAVGASPDGSGGKASQGVEDSLISGHDLSGGSDGKVTDHISTSGASRDPLDVRIPYAAPRPMGKRLSWRELVVK